MGESTFGSELQLHMFLPIQGNEDPLPLAQCRGRCHGPEHSGEKESEKYENLLLIGTESAFCTHWIILEKKVAFHENQFKNDQLLKVFSEQVRFIIRAYCQKSIWEMQMIPKT